MFDNPNEVSEVSSNTLKPSFSELITKSELEKKSPYLASSVLNVLSDESNRNGGIICCFYDDNTFVFDKEYVKDSADWVMIAAKVAEAAETTSPLKYCHAERETILSELNRAKTLQKKEKKNSNNEFQEYTGKSAEFISVLGEFYKAGASDVHFVLSGDECLVYGRYNGVIGLIPRRLKYQDALSMISAVFFKSGQHASEEFKVNGDRGTKLPDVPLLNKDGGSDFIELRIHYRSLTNGERGNKVCAVRFTSSGKARKLDDLNIIDDRTLNILKSVMSSSSGMILITGPTGGGKSTLMHACLAEKPKDAIVHTVEDPIEQVSEDPLTFQGEKKDGEDELKDLMRLDPDIIVAGEMRDAETAQDALAMARTGHLVLSTFHANDSLSALERLVDMGIGYSVLSQDALIKLTTAQRLVPVLCKCKKRVTPYQEGAKRSVYTATWQNWMKVANEEKFSRLVELAKNKKLFVRNEEGCIECARTGIRDRQLIVEYTIFDATARRFIKNGDLAGLRESLVQRGWRSLSDQAWELIEQGITDPDLASRQVQNLIMDSSREWQY